jgi:hypothetical protein
MAFESLKNMISNNTVKSVKSVKSAKSTKKEQNDSLFSNIGEFGSISGNKNSIETDNTVVPKSMGSNMFGYLIKSKSDSDDLFTLKKSPRANDSLSHDSLSHDSLSHDSLSLSGNSGRKSQINMDSIKDLAKTSVSNATSTKYLRIFGITVLLFLLIGSVLIKSAPQNMEDVKNKFFGMVDFSEWFEDEPPPPPPPPLKKRKGPLNITETDEEKMMNKPAEDRHKYKPHVMPDDAASMVQSSKASGKSGWCYIGEDRGFRSCVNVNTNDTCMSGKIFENQEKCIHPELRM